MGLLTINSAAVTSWLCDTSIEFSSPAGAGVYYTDIELGPATGIVNITCGPGNIPDRFEVFYNGSLVADSKFVGDYLTGNPPDASTVLWEGTPGSGQFVGHVYNGIPDLVWNGSSYVASGPTTDFTILQSDIADFGSTADGGSISFNKNLTGVTVVTIKVTSVVTNTGWAFLVGCPTPLV